MRLRRRRGIIAGIAAGLVLAAAGTYLALGLLYPLKYRAEVAEYSARYGLSAALVCGVIRTESRFDPERVSEAGAVGLMQLMPSTALYIAEKEGIGGFDFARLYEAEFNIELGCAYLSYLVARFGDMSVALAAYNAGEGTVKQWLGNRDYSPDGKILTAIPYAETRGYADKVYAAGRIYARLYGLTAE